MEIFVTDTSYIWNRMSAALLPYKDAVTVINMSGRDAEDGYECVTVTGKESRGCAGAGSEKYKELLRLMTGKGRGDDIVFLCDDTLESLYIFSCARAMGHIGSIHLCLVKPRPDASEEYIRSFIELTKGYENADSLFYITDDDVNGASREGGTKENESREEKIAEYYCEMLPHILRGAGRIDGWDNIDETSVPGEKFFFDHKIRKYISVKKGYDRAIEHAQNEESDAGEIDAQRKLVTMGLIVCIDEPSTEPDDKIAAESIYPRPDGKRICEYLKNMRKALADANGIEFTPRDCPSNGPCAGTCDACDGEAYFLLEAMGDIDPDKRIYPRQVLKEWEVFK